MNKGIFRTPTRVSAVWAGLALHTSCYWVGGSVQSNVALTSPHEGEVVADVWYGFSAYGTSDEGVPSDVIGLTEAVLFPRLRLGMMNGVGLGHRQCWGYEGTVQFSVGLCTTGTIDFGARMVVPVQEQVQYRPYIGVINPELGFAISVNLRPQHKGNRYGYRWLRIMPTIAVDTGFQFGRDAHFIAVPKAGISISIQRKHCNEAGFLIHGCSE